MNTSKKPYNPLCFFACPSSIFLFFFLKIFESDLGSSTYRTLVSLPRPKYLARLHYKTGRKDCCSQTALTADLLPIGEVTTLTLHIAQQRRPMAQSYEAMAPGQPLVGVIWHLPGRPRCHIKYLRSPCCYRL